MEIKDLCLINQKELHSIIENCYAPLKLFCPHRPLGSPGVRGKICVIKKGGALEKRVICVII